MPAEIADVSIDIFWRKVVGRAPEQVNRAGPSHSAVKIDGNLMAEN
jgi:hypothetical protein